MIYSVKIKVCQFFGLSNYTQMSSNIQAVKLVAVGDGAVGESRFYVLAAGGIRA